MRRLEDFRDLLFAAVAQALARLARAGHIERLSKGLYYRARQTAFGTGRPNPAAIQQLAAIDIFLEARCVQPCGATRPRLSVGTRDSPDRDDL